MIVACPACQTRYEVDSSRLRGGKGRLRCARCSAVFAVEAAAPVAPAPSPPPSEDAPRAPTRRLEVALIAMEPGATRDGILALLSAQRVRTLTASDGPGALDSAKRSRPHLAVLAYRLAGLLGPEVAQAIHDERALAGVLIVLVGGPEFAAKRGAGPTAAHGVEAHLRIDADPLTIERTLLGVLGLASTTVTGPDRDELARLAWMAAADADVYHPDVVRAARGGRARTAEVDALIERSRQGCLERHPELRCIAGGIDPFIEELERALGLRG